MKRQVCLYLDAEAVEVMKSKRVNISSLLNGLIQVESGMTNKEQEDISFLKIANAKLIEENKRLTTELAKKEEVKKEYDKRTIHL